MGEWRPPEFNANEFCKVLLRLGFTEQRKKANHGRKFTHPTIQSNCKMPFILVPNQLYKNKEFQKALFRDLFKCWDLDLEEVKKAFKK